MFKNVSSQKLIVYVYDSTTNLPKTGDAANLTAYVSIDYGTVTAITDTSAAEMDATNAKGFYLFDLSQAETNGNCLMFSCKSSTASMVCLAMPAVVFTTPPNFSALAITGGGVTLADAVSHGGTLGSSTATLALSRLSLSSQTANTAALTVTGNGSGNGATITGGAASGSTAGGHGLAVVGGASTTTAGGTAGAALRIVGGAGSASTNASGEAAIFASGANAGAGAGNALTISNTVSVSAALQLSSLQVTGGTTLTNASGAGLTITASSGSPAVSITDGGSGMTGGVEITGRIGMKITATAGNAVTLTAAGNGHAIQATGAGTGDGIRATTIHSTGAVSFDTTWTVTGATTLTGAVTASNGSNAITGVTAAVTGDFTATMKTSLGTAVAGSSVASVSGDVGGKVLGGGAGVITAVGAWAAGSAGAAVSTLTQAQVTGGAYALDSASFAFNAALPLTTQQKADVTAVVPTAAAAATAVWASVARTLTSLSGLTVDTVTTAVNLTNNNDKSGYSLAANQHVIVDSGTVTNLTNLPTAPTDWITAAAVSAAAVTKIQSGLSTYGGGDTSGTTTLLGRLTAARAGYLDFINNANLVNVPIFPTNFASIVINSNGDIARVTLVDTATVSTNLTNLPSIPANWLTGAGIAADAVTKVQAGLATPTNITAASGVTLTSAYDPAKTAAQAGDAMTLTVGTGSALVAATAAQVTTDHGFGSYVRNTEPVDVSASVALIKAKTDNLPASPAAVGSAMTLTTGERDAIAVAILDLADGVETGETVRKVLRGLAASLFHNVSSDGTTYYAPDGTTVRLTVAADSPSGRLVTPSL